MFELRVVDPVPGLESLGRSVQLREQPYGVVCPILSEARPRGHEWLLVVTLHVDGVPLGTLEALDALPGRYLVPLLNAIPVASAFYQVETGQSAHAPGPEDDDDGDDDGDEGPDKGPDESGETATAGRVPALGEV